MLAHQCKCEGIWRIKVIVAKQEPIYMRISMGDPIFIFPFCVCFKCYFKAVAQEDKDVSPVCFFICLLKWPA